MKTKEFYEYFINGKKYNLLQEKLVMYNYNVNRHSSERTIQFNYYIRETNSFVKFDLKFPLEVRSFETGSSVKKLNLRNRFTEDSISCPNIMLSFILDHKDYFFPCEKEVVTKSFLVKKMEKDLNSYWHSKKSYKFFIEYEELYNL